MVFPTITFAVFFAVVLPVSWALVRTPGAWKWFLVVASYVFYAAADWKFLFLLGGVTLGNHLFAHLIHRADDEERRKWLVRIVVTLDLLLLGVFKYYGFFVEQADAALDDVGLGAPFPVLSIALPVGISFITFHAISYVVDVGRRQLQPPPIVDLALYMSFFPHLVAGPIVRASEFLPQLRRPLDPKRVAVGTGVLLIVVGLVKKVVIADTLAREVVDPVFAVPEAYSSADTLLAFYGYAVQIYCDFSGYTDIAIGIAMLMGLTFPKNFDRPFASQSIGEFWRRWHMTLSRFVRDYIYIPLGGARKGPARGLINNFITMVLVGLWHGAAWGFIVFGAMHGFVMGAERVWTQKFRWRPPTWGKHVLVLLFLGFSLVPFRAPDMNDVFVLWGQLFAEGPATLWSPVPVLMIVAVIGSHLLPLRAVFRVRKWVADLPVPALSAGLAATVVVVAATIPSQGVPPFIYFQF
ncbi:MBOAT family protein [Conexibacter sp. SYSU D00693]|uniref:MBOAT family O-acyltransferase n=1 Tax=Conexibacter sp. SYSU D00693 TaxID=2812560 RepID=UPI00196B7629|nr:MBOAT family protein [Conexibacter sp. SYSU D00693]